jgi:hypothetical protein
MTILTTVITFVTAHSAMLAAATVAVIDLVIALVPSLAGNGILHQILLLAQSKQAPASQPAPSPQKPPQA